MWTQDRVSAKSTGRGTAEPDCAYRGTPGRKRDPEPAELSGDASIALTTDSCGCHAIRTDQDIAGSSASPAARCSALRSVSRRWY